MYSPKIKEEFIPILFKVSVSQKIPMTRLVNQIIKEYLERESSNKPEKVTNKARKS